MKPGGLTIQKQKEGRSARGEAPAREVCLSQDEGWTVTVHVDAMECARGCLHSTGTPISRRWRRQLAKLKRPFRRAFGLEVYSVSVDGLMMVYVGEEVPF